jgi:hypothetical protein
VVGLGGVVVRIVLVVPKPVATTTPAESVERKDANMEEYESGGIGSDIVDGSRINRTVTDVVGG